jgi:hypothetical protein
MSRPRTKQARLATVLAVASGLGGLLAGCSDPGLYWDRRETIALGGNDAVAANEATQMVDPWPPGSGNRNITYNGEKMQTAVERYRTDRVIPPTSATTSVFDAPPAAAAPPPAVQAGAPVTTTASQ